jgi:folate-binding Fe-S cluster repair protein YgfZ
MSESSWLAPTQPDVVWFSGTDSLRFLNDLISQEIGGMEPGDSRRSFLLEPQGKLRFLLWVIRDGDRYGLITEDGRGSELVSALGRYRIRVDVEIEEEEGGAWIVVGECDGYDLSWPGVERRLVIGDRPELPDGFEAEYEQLRVLAGEPKWGVDVDDNTIPHESLVCRSCAHRSSSHCCSGGPAPASWWSAMIFASPIGEKAMSRHCAPPRLRQASRWM